MRGQKKQPPQSLQRQSTPGEWHVATFPFADIFYGLNSTGKHPRLLVFVLSLSQIVGSLRATVFEFLNEFQLLE
jgi:hypothetical protein